MCRVSAVFRSDVLRSICFAPQRKQRIRSQSENPIYTDKGNIRLDRFAFDSLAHGIIFPRLFSRYEVSFPRKTSRRGVSRSYSRSWQENRERVLVARKTAAWPLAARKRSPSFPSRENAERRFRINSEKLTISPIALPYRVETRWLLVFHCAAPRLQRNSNSRRSEKET